MTDKAKEERRRYYKMWRAENREKVNEYSKRWRRSHPDSIKAYNKAYWEKRAAQGAADGER